MELKNYIDDVYLPKVSLYDHGWWFSWSESTHGLLLHLLLRLSPGTCCKVGICISALKAIGNKHIIFSTKKNEQFTQIEELLI
jgi:hypothetical protein